MFRLFGLLLVGFAVSVFTAASAHAVTCERTTHTHNGFVSKGAFESWFPKTLHLNDRKFVKKAENSKQLVQKYEKITWSLLPNGKLVGSWKQQAGFRQVDPVRYKCDKTSIQVASSTTTQSNTVAFNLASLSDSVLCVYASTNGEWDLSNPLHVKEAKRRGLSCGVGEVADTQIASSSAYPGMPAIFQFSDKIKFLHEPSNTSVIFSEKGQILAFDFDKYKYDGLTRFTNGFSQDKGGQYKPKEVQYGLLIKPESGICDDTFDRYTPKTAKAKIFDTNGDKYPDFIELYGISFDKIPVSGRYVDFFVEAEGQGVCNAFGSTARNKLELARLKQFLVKQKTLPATQIASTTTAQSNIPTSAELTAAQKEAERLRQELAALKAQQEQQQQTISNDTQIPLITIVSANTKGKQGVIRGRASDNVGVAEVTASGQPVPFDAAGNFQYQTFVPTGGKDIVIEVTDVAGLTSKQTVSLTRSAGTATAAITFDSLNPLGRHVATNKDALALIIGVDDYENTPARAIYADSDAQMFADYATEKLGIPANRIKTLVNDSADFGDVLLSVREWLGRSVRQNKTDVHVFFAGHGLASENGEEMYLLPYDGRPRLLNETAISRERLFADISAANPRSVTVFLDTCYSGTTRGTDMLIASRPIAIRALEQSIPDNFTVITAAAGDQTAKPLIEAKHGMFSYFLMKGMEGEADANNDNEITAGELHNYVEQNVWQQSSNTQLPQIQGNKDRVLVRFQ